MKRKKLLFVINTLGRAGAEAALMELLRQLSEGDYEISLYVLMGQGELVHQIPPGVKLLNDTYCDVSVLSGEGRKYMRRTVAKSLLARGNVIRLLPYFLSNLTDMVRKRRILPDKLLWRFLSDGGKRFDEEYDLAIAYLEGGSAYYVADHVRAKRKAVFIHIDYGRAGYTRKLDRNCYPGFDQIFTVSDEVRERFLTAYPECADYTQVFHNMLNPGRIRSMSQQPGGFTDDFDGIRLLTVGRLSPQKAYEIAIDALKLLKDQGCCVRWYILGEGDQRPILEKKIRSLGLTEDFILLGAQPNPFPYYAQTDIYVHATRYEGKSIAIQEAQILGCAIVASDCSGNREQIEDGVDGSLCELSAEGICRSIAYLVQHPEVRESYQRAVVDKHYLYNQDFQKFLLLLKDGEA